MELIHEEVREKIQNAVILAVLEMNVDPGERSLMNNAMVLDDV
jgi:hypothetical protein